VSFAFFYNYLWSCYCSYVRPMNRFASNSVAAAFVSVWLRASYPTNMTSSLMTETIDGMMWFPEEEKNGWDKCRVAFRLFSIDADLFHLQSHLPLHLILVSMQHMKMSCQDQYQQPMENKDENEGDDDTIFGKWSYCFSLSFFLLLVVELATSLLAMPIGIYQLLRR
jgi:hypothetical protein